MIAGGVEGCLKGIGGLTPPTAFGRVIIEIADSCFIGRSNILDTIDATLNLRGRTTYQCRLLTSI